MREESHRRGGCQIVFLKRAIPGHHMALPGPSINLLFSLVFKSNPIIFRYASKAKGLSHLRQARFIKISKSFVSQARWDKNTLWLKHNIIQDNIQDLFEKIKLVNIRAYNFQKKIKHILWKFNISKENKTSLKIRLRK